MNYLNKLAISGCLLAINLCAYGDQYELLMSKDDTVCQPLLKIYNDDLSKHGKIILDNHTEFNWVEWKDINFTDEQGNFLKTKMSSVREYERFNHMQATLFDINNDGINETVIRSFYNDHIYHNVFPQPTQINFSTQDLYEKLITGTILWSAGRFSFGSKRLLSVRDELEYEISVLGKLAFKKIIPFDDRSPNYSNGFSYFRKFYRDAYFYPLKLKGVYYVVRFGFYEDNNTETEHNTSNRQFHNSNINFVYKHDEPFDSSKPYKRPKSQLICFLLKTSTKESNI